MGGRSEVSIISHRPVTSSDLKQERFFYWLVSVSTLLQLVVALYQWQMTRKTVNKSLCYPSVSRHNKILRQNRFVGLNHIHCITDCNEIYCRQKNSGRVKISLVK